MQRLYVLYVRIGYYEKRHPVRFGAAAAIAMVAVLWPVFWRMGATLHESATHALFSAATYSVGFCALNALFSRTRRRQARFERWASKHPEPSSLRDAPRPEPISAVIPRGFRARAAWVAWTLVVAIGVSWFLGLFASAIEGFQGGGGAEALVLLPLAIVTAVLLRLYWPPLRHWKSRS